jgi:catechol-2,3-dioxygenase
VHIAVTNLEASLSYYQNTFGMSLIVNHGGQAGFISWDGLYHHIAMNTWDGPFENLHQPTYLGLDFVEFALPALPAGTYIDPNGINIVSTG